jgi:alpha-1,2-rhamnosyltransferase
MPRIVFVECTLTYHSDLGVGIPRVVRNILRNAPDVAQRYGYEIVPVIVDGERFRVTDAAQVLANTHSGVASASAGSAPVAELATPPQSLNWRGRLRKRLQPFWRGVLKILAFALPFRRAWQFIYARPAQPGLARCICLPVRFLRAMLGRTPSALRPNADILDIYDRLDGSVLLLLDASWWTSPWPATRRFKTAGGKVISVIYDLIPITHNHLYGPELRSLFECWMAEQIRLADGFVGISRFTADVLAGYLDKAGNDKTGDDGGRGHHAPIGHFHLGSELDLIEPGQSVRPLLNEIFAPDRHVFLMVGTIEPRKRHAVVLDAFDLFWANGGVGALVLVGRHSWKTEEFLARVASHPQFGQQLFLLRDATDTELDFCYRHASSLVMASEVEGFGLPVVEALQRGLPVMCSDIPVFHEIADGRAEFFAFDDPAACAAVLARFCDRVPLSDRSRRTPQRWLDWKQSTEALFEAMMPMIGAHPVSKVMTSAH